MSRVPVMLSRALIVGSQRSFLHHVRWRRRTVGTWDFLASSMAFSTSNSSCDSQSSERSSVISFIAA